MQPSDVGIYRLYLANAAAPDLLNTSPNRSFTLTVLPDTDGDGLPDEWEAAHGLEPASPADALVDADGDGLSTLAEYQSGTVPTNAASAFRLDTARSGDGSVTLSFEASANFRDTGFGPTCRSPCIDAVTAKVRPAFPKRGSRSSKPC